MAAVLAGHSEPTELEEALVALARRSCDAPATLTTNDLDPVRALAGERGAVDFAVVATAFHFINRIADLLDVDPEALPETLRRIEPLRRLAVWAASRLMRRMDLANRRYPLAFEDVLERERPVFERALGAGLDPAWLEPLRTAPKVVELVALALRERDENSSLDRATLERVHATVAGALAATADAMRGFERRPHDPIDAFAFVGTRYAARTTVEMIRRLREHGLDDRGILDLAIAVADANQWERMHRLLGLPRALYALDEQAQAETRAEAAQR